MAGVDISEDYLLEYRQIFNTNAVQANAMALPFRDRTFDIVSYCEILEHLHHPFLGLCEVNRVLRDGGVIILSTNYRCRLSRECTNPFIAVERLLSLYFDNVLGSRDVLRRFGKMAFYHTEFSKSEIIQLLKSSGFDLVEFHTYFAKRKMLSKLFKHIPVLRFTGGSILVIAAKRDISHIPLAQAKPEA
jgi:ubiquinone/menaquinone biosynthesis C-methylase UbiE